MTRRRAVALAAALLALAAGPLGAQDRLVVLVRHAEAAGDPPRDPPLTADGQARATALAAALEGLAIGAVIVSPFQRTGLTAASIAEARGLTPMVVEVSGGVPAHVAAVAAAVKARPPGQTVLVVGHSNTIPAIIGALGGPQLGDLCHGQFSGLFLLRLRGESAELIRAWYGAPDGPDACEPSG